MSNSFSFVSWKHKISKFETYCTKSGYSRRVLSPHTFSEAMLRFLREVELQCLCTVPGLFKFTYSPGWSYFCELSRGWGSVWFGSLLSVLSPLTWLATLGPGFLNLIPPAA